MRRGAGVGGVRAIGALLLATSLLFGPAANAARMSGRIVAATGRVKVPVSCPGVPLSFCTISVTLKADVQNVGNGRRTTVGRASHKLLGGERAKLAVSLDQRARRLLSKRHQLVVKYTAMAAPEALTGTIVIRAYSFGGPYPGTAIPLEGAIEVARLNLEGEVLGSIETKQRTIHVAPGLYRIGRNREVAVDVGQTVEASDEGPPVP